MVRIRHHSKSSLVTATAFDSEHSRTYLKMYLAKLISSFVASTILQQAAGWGLTTYTSTDCNSLTRIAFISGNDDQDVDCTQIPLPEGATEMPNALAVGGIVDGPSVTLYSGPDCDNDDNILTVIDDTTIRKVS